MRISQAFRSNFDAKQVLNNQDFKNGPVFLETVDFDKLKRHKRDTRRARPSVKKEDPNYAFFWSQLLAVFYLNGLPVTSTSWCHLKRNHRITEYCFKSCSNHTIVSLHQLFYEM